TVSLKGIVIGPIATAIIIAPTNKNNSKRILNCLVGCLCNWGVFDFSISYLLFTICLHLYKRHVQQEGRSLLRKYCTYRRPLFDSKTYDTNKYASNASFLRWLPT